MKQLDNTGRDLDLFHKDKKSPSRGCKVRFIKILWYNEHFYLRLILFHVGFSLSVVNWIMSSVTFVSFIVFINGFVSTFFKSTKGLRKGCSLSPLVSLIGIEGLSRVMEVNIHKFVSNFNGFGDGVEKSLNDCFPFRSFNLYEGVI